MMCKRVLRTFNKILLLMLGGSWRPKGRIRDTEDGLESVKSELTDAAKHIVYLESKTEDLENRGRRKNLRLVGLPKNAEKTQPMTDYIQHMLPIWLGLTLAGRSLWKEHTALWQDQDRIRAEL